MYVLKILFLFILELSDVHPVLAGRIDDLFSILNGSCRPVVIDEAESSPTAYPLFSPISCADGNPEIPSGDPVDWSLDREEPAPEYEQGSNA